MSSRKLVGQAVGELYLAIRRRTRRRLSDLCGNTTWEMFCKLNEIVFIKRVMLDIKDT